MYRPVPYHDEIVKSFVIATVAWLLFGLCAGFWAALELSYPILNLNEHINFGRLRPCHTTGVVIAFSTNALMATSFYVVQRTCRATLWGSNTLHKFIFWGFQIYCLLAVTGYVNGITRSQEYAESEWYNAILMGIVFICYFIVYFMTLRARQEPHIYVSNWFYLAFIATVIILHITNNISIPTWFGSTKSYPIYSGVQSAMVQWWYGHNMVGFLLTSGFIGMMYYFIPKQAKRPVYSYRLSIIHFWSLIFVYIWAGPHHLHYTALPDWVQTLGMTFSIMLWMPSWGGMINGIMTLNGAWYKLKQDPVLCFMVIAVSFYGMSTFEGPLLAIKEVNALAHYSDWIIGHVHSGALGWVGFMAIGSLYYLVPNLWKADAIYSIKLVRIHLWVASTGIVLYITAMWIAGIMQGLMWRAYNALGFLEYSFIDVVEANHPLYVIRAIGGGLYLLGAILMAYNFIMTIKSAKKFNIAIEGNKHAF